MKSHKPLPTYLGSYAELHGASDLNLNIDSAFSFAHVCLGTNQFGLPVLQASGKLHWILRPHSMLLALKMSRWKSFTDHSQLSNLTPQKKNRPNSLRDSPVETQSSLGHNIMWPVALGLSVPKRGASTRKFGKTSRRLQPKLLNGILSRVQLRGNDANSREHREAAVVNLTLLSMAAMPWGLWIQQTKKNFPKVSPTENMY